MEVSDNIDIVKYVYELMDKIQNNLYDRAKARRDKMTYHVTTVDEIKKILDTQPGFIIADWCGNVECENALKEIGGLKSRCILENEKPTNKCVVCGKDSKYRVVWGIQY